MKTFEEWCQDREVVINELSPKLLTMAYKIWGEECFYEAKKYEAENAALRERLEKSYAKDTYDWAKDAGERLLEQVILKGQGWRRL